MEDNVLPRIYCADTTRPPAIHDRVLELPIANMARVNGHIIRGETLWASRNRNFLQDVKDAGVETIIDFRTADHTDSFEDMCRKEGLEYRHFPIDKANQPDENLLALLPELFELLDNRKCYISCQQGLHRTDIALAIYYMFHRSEHVPDLVGHWKKEELRCDDIMRRLNSLHKALTPERARETGLRYLDDFEYKRRRKILLDTNRRRIAEKRQ